MHSNYLLASSSGEKAVWVYVGFGICAHLPLGQDITVMLENSILPTDTRLGWFKWECRASYKTLKVTQPSDSVWGGLTQQKRFRWQVYILEIFRHLNMSVVKNYNDISLLIFS